MEIIILLIILILFSIFNGLVIKWKLSNDVIKSAKLSKQWHGVVLVIHILSILLLYLLGGLLWGIIGGVLNWLIHNIIIALMLKQKWYYVGKTAWFDKMIRKILPFINFD
jgi:hypothetical protein